MQKKICVDFDGVIHSYDSGWQGACQIPDQPVDGAFEWLGRLVWQGFEVSIYSARSKEEGAIEAMQRWFTDHDISVWTLERLRFPTQKPAAHLTVDDRAFCFQGDFPSVGWVERFQPWTKLRRNE